MNLPGEHVRLPQNSQSGPARRMIAIVAILALIIGCSFIFRAWSADPLVFPAGSAGAAVLPELRRSQVGPLANQTHLLEQYAELSAIYQTLPLVTAPETSADSRIRLRLDEAMSELPDQTGVSGLTVEQRTQLIDLVCFLYWSMTGPDLETYKGEAVRRLGPLSRPASMPRLRSIATDFGFPLLPDDATPEALEDYLAAHHAGFKAAEIGTISGIRLDSPGFLVVAAREPVPTVFNDLLWNYDEQAVDFFLGSLSEEALILRETFPGPTEATTVLRCEVCTIVSTTGGDRFPVVIRLEWAGTQWGVRSITRQVSPRVVMSPHMIF